MRLHKYIAQSGIASRRKAEDLIRMGRVKVNDIVVNHMGVMIDPTQDTVKIDNQAIGIEERKIYIMLNKPEGYVTTVSDEFNRPTIMDLVKEITERIYPVGRLDYDTSGLLLMTNDGDLTYHLTHPKHEIPKTYIVKVQGFLLENEQKQFKNGIDIGGYVTAPAYLEVLKREKDSSLVKVIIHEGKNRQIRKMFDSLDHPVIKLKRIAVGKLNLKELTRGKWRYLSEEEVKYLLNL